ncbi:MAG: hypothetical protein QG604_656 [Candidatus Dependentiae bacterium]|nr:hypothetical protein [Candidatus Dependentiae bacterium]
MAMLKNLVLSSLLLSGAVPLTIHGVTLNPMNQPFMTLKISDETSTFARAIGSMAFIKWTTKDVTICNSSALNGTVSATKYEKKDGQLVPVKSEEFTGRADGYTQCTRKGENARKAVPLAERTARMLRATANLTDMSQVKFVDLYNSYAPIWLQAESAADVREFVDTMQVDLAAAAIDPAVRPAQFRQVCLITIKKDPLLSTLDEQLLADLAELFNPGSFMNADLRKYVLAEKDVLCEIREDSKDALDINPSVLEGLFEDLTKENYFWKKSLFFRDITKQVFSLKHITKYATAGMLGYMGYAFGKYVVESVKGKPEPVLEKPNAQTAFIIEAIKAGKA